MRIPGARPVVSLCAALLLVSAWVTPDLEAVPPRIATQQQGVGGAPNVVVPGGVSPGGRYEIRVFEISEPTPSNYVIAFVDGATRRVINEISPSGGYFSYADARRDAEEVGRSLIVRALWHGGGRFVAITDAGTAHSRELYLYEVTGANVVRIKLPDYPQNALGRVGSTETASTAVTELRRWDGDILQATFTFRAQNPRPGGMSPTFVVPFSLRVWPGTPGYVTFQSMGKPVSGVRR
jgi:hypothetical protein